MLTLFVKLDQTFVDFKVGDLGFFKKLKNMFMNYSIIPFSIRLFRIFFDHLFDLRFSHLLQIIVSLFDDFDAHPAELVMENRTD